MLASNLVNSSFSWVIGLVLQVLFPSLISTVTGEKYRQVHLNTWDYILFISDE